MSKKAKSAFDLESLEPRLLFSAESLLAPIDAGAVVADTGPVLQVALAKGNDLREQSEFQPAAARELIFVDGGVEDVQQLINDLKSPEDDNQQYAFIVLDSARDGITQISETLEQYQGVMAVHLISHGNDGELQLGNTLLTADNLDQYATQIQGWQQSLTAQADFLFYSCNLAQGENGKEFLANLSRLTAADIAASDDLTGPLALGGDWDLEYTLGQVDTSNAFNEPVQKTWSGLLVVESYQQGDVNGYSGTEDTFIDRTIPGTAQNSDDLTVHMGDREALIKFGNIFGSGPNQIPLGAKINSATLTLSVSGLEANSTLSIHQLLTNWNESSTWNSLVNGVQLGTEAIASADDSVSGSLAKVDVDVTASVTAWAAGASNEGWVIKSDYANDWKGISSEKSTFVDRPLLTIDYTPVSGLWLSTDGDLLVPSGAPGLSSWEDGHVLAFDPTSFGAGSTSGSFSTRFFIENFGDDANLTGLHYVTTNLSVGGPNAIGLQPGNLLFAIDKTTWLSSNNALWALKGDIVLFRPDVVGDYSQGTFTVLLYTPLGTDIEALTLIEAPTAVGDANLNAGDFLLVSKNSTDILLYEVNDVGVATSGTTSLFLQGADIGIDQKIYGIDLIESSTTLAGTTLLSGEMLVALKSPDTQVGDNIIPVTEYDIFSLNITKTNYVSASAKADAAMFFQGGNVGLNEPEEALNGLTLAEQPQTSAPPSLSVANGPVNYTPSDPATIIDASATVTDFDSVNFEDGKLTVYFGSGGSANDRLEINNQGTGAGQISISGSNVKYEGTTIGSVSGGTDGSTPLVITFNVMADQAAVQALVRNITYENVSATPAPDSRIVRFSISDGDGGVSSIETATINIITPNTAPTAANKTIIINEDPITPYPFVAADFNYSDADSDPFTQIQITSLETVGTLTFNSSDVPLNLVVTKAQIDAGLLQFTPLANGSGSGYDSFDFKVHDGIEYSSSAYTMTIDVTSVNDAPQLDNTGEMTLTNVIENDSNPSGNSVATIISIAGGERISDPDTGALEGIAVIGVDDSNGQWEYSIDNGTTWLSFVIDSGVANGIIDNSAAVVLDTSALIRFVPNASYSGNAGDISFRAWDQTDSLASGTAGVNVATNGNAAPYSAATETASLEVVPEAGLINLLPAAQNVDEDTTLVFSTAGGNSISVDDGLSGDNLLRTSLSVSNGSLTLASLSGLTIESGADGSSDITIIGLESAINAALDGLNYDPIGGYVGADSLQVSTDLLGAVEGYYSFDNLADPGNDDSDAGAADGTVVGATAVVDTERGNVLSFDGDDHVQIAGNFSDPANVTLAAWVNLNGVQTKDELISLGDNVAIRLNESGAAGVQGFFYNGSTWQHTNSGRFFDSTGWHHVAYTFDDASNTQVLYIDGVAVGTTSYTASISYTQGTDTFLGRNGNSATAFLHGKLDDARIYSRALSADDIALLYQEQVSQSASCSLTVDPVNDAPTVNATASDSGTEDTDVVYTHAELLNLIGAADVDDLDSALSISISNVNDGSVALSGGSTPQHLFARLAAAPYRSQVDWSSVLIFWGDERAVPPDHSESNFRMAKENLLDRVPIPADQIFRMEGERPAQEAAVRYEKVLQRAFSLKNKEGVPRFDLILLGMGSDGHTASLFPETSVIKETEQWVAAPWVEKFHAHRITLDAGIELPAGCLDRSAVCPFELPIGLTAALTRLAAHARNLRTLSDRLVAEGKKTGGCSHAARPMHGTIRGT